MKTFKRVLLAIFLVVAAAVVFLILKKPAQRPASDEKVERTPARLERGRYLAETVLSCMHCHTKPTATRFGGLGDRDRLGAGGLCWGIDIEFPGTVCSKNLTSDPETGLGKWTDGEIMRAIREGISRDGTPLFPIMSYTEYRALPDEDVRALVVYLRSLKPIHNEIAPHVLPLPLNIIVKFIPKPVEGPVADVSRTDTVAYGDYLTHVGGCRTCHSPVDSKHNLIPGKEFSGGQEFRFNGLDVRSANLTPDETGLGKKQKSEFIAQFRSFGAPEMWDVKVEPSQNTIMPWLTLSHASDEDLGAIYDYLRTLPAIANPIEKHPHPAAPAATAPAENGDASGADSR